MLGETVDPHLLVQLLSRLAARHKAPATVKAYTDDWVLLTVENENDPCVDNRHLYLVTSWGGPAQPGLYRLPASSDGCITNSD